MIIKKTQQQIEQKSYNCKPQTYQKQMHFGPKMYGSLFLSFILVCLGLEGISDRNKDY